MSCECEMFLFRGFFYGISSPVQMMTKARTIQRGKGNSQDPWFIRVKERTDHVLEDADRGKWSCKAGNPFRLDFCACLYLELLFLTFLSLQREEPRGGLHALTQWGLTASPSWLALGRTMRGTLPMRTGSIVCWFGEAPGRRKLCRSLQGQVAFSVSLHVTCPCQVLIVNWRERKDSLLKSIK